MTKWVSIRVLTLLVICLAAAGQLTAQVTTSEIIGTVVDEQGAVVPNAVVTAIHEPSGTKYTSVTNSEGRYTLPALRVGGPYTVTVERQGFSKQERKDIMLGLGNTSTVDITLGVAGVGAEVTVTSDYTFNEGRTGAATSVPRTTIETLPTLNRTITDFTRLTPQAGRDGSFAGQDNRMNNITVDGSYFNNSFGLRALPGDTSGVSPISLDAIEEVQVNIAPFDVRQGNFVGAGVNTVTRSGTNDYKGSFYYLWRHPGLVGRDAGANKFNPGDFKYKNWGFRVGGPLPFFNFGEHNDNMFISGKNKLFFFFSYENEEESRPATTYEANTGGQPVGGNTTRVLASDLDALSSYLRTNFNYDTGPYQGYPALIPGEKYLARVDYNINDTNKAHFRYIHLDSSRDALTSGSSSAGSGRGVNTTNWLGFQNSGYSILENIRSLVGEWTSTYGGRASNTLIMGYTKQDESRGYKSELFPFIDILKDGVPYTSFGFEPFTPNNELRYNTFQIQDNLTFYRGRHTYTGGLSYELYRSENVFFQQSQSVYVYNSLADFYADANGYLANPTRTTSPITLNRFQVQWTNIPGMDKPVQPLKVNYWGFYGQDVWKMRDNFTLTYGLRADVPFFAATGFVNPVANALTFRDDDGSAVQYRTEKLPDPNILWSPRVGFNWSPFNSGDLQVRGGTGVFTGKPAYVWISNQIGTNGLLTGSQNVTNTMTRPFHPDTRHYWPATVTGAPAATFALAVTEPDFKFPQLWRTNIGADLRIPLGLVLSGEVIYSRDVNGIYYVQANLPAAQTTFNGPDNRPRWTSNRINSAVSDAIVLKNQNDGRSWSVGGSLEKPYWHGFYAKAGYNYGITKNTVDPGSIANGSWFNNPYVGDPNNPGLGISNFSPKNRFFATASYTIDYFKFGSTSFSAFWETRNWGNTSYVYSSDLNGDGGSGNDLLYVPKDVSEMNFVQPSGFAFTVAQQQEAFEKFIQADDYLRTRRGQYAERGAAFLPLVTRVDFSARQEVYFKTGNRKHRFQISANILNFGNLLNKEWGLGTVFNVTNGVNNATPLVPRGPDSSGRPTYTLNVTGGALLSDPYRKTAGTGDVYRIQLGLRYIFD